MKLKIKWDIDSAALIVAFLAVSMAFWEGYESRQHNRKSVSPILNFFSNKSYEDNNSQFSIILKSVGLGPAHITDFAVFFNKRREQVFIQPGFQTAYISTISAANGFVNDYNENNDADVSLGVTDQMLEKDTYFAEDDSRVLLSFESDLAQQDMRRLISTVENTLDIFVCYCSIYEDQCRRVHWGQNPNLTDQMCQVPEQEE